MKSSFTRRTFIKRSALAAGSVSALPMFSGLNILAADSPGRKLNCVQIGCGGRGLTAHLDWLVKNSKDNVVAIVDPDEKRQAEVKRFLQSHEVDADKVEVFADYRKMYDKIGKQIDAVFIAAPNHHHAPAASLAIQLGKAVYCEKPLTHDIAEARKLREMARASKAATQMGNQGHCMDGYRSLCELIWSGQMGNIKETHSWTDRANGGTGPRPPAKPAPSNLHWDEWVGPAPYRDFHEDLHPHEWHGWFDFGNGSLGNMGCHVLDGVFWALKIEHPTSMEAEEIRGGSDERYPTGSRLRFDIPARAGMPAFKAYWYEGLKKDAKSKPGGDLRAAQGADRNFPPMLHDLMKQYPDEELAKPDSGTLYIAEKGVIYTQTYGGKMHVLPLETYQQMKHPAQTLPRPKNVFTDFLDAVRAGKKETSASFEYGAQLTEFTLLGNLAQHAGVGKKIEWDGPNMKVTNIDDLNQWLKRPHRKGWSV
jgi:predicted dehydrogenase